jgi:hypothetical protein
MRKLLSLFVLFLFVMESCKKGSDSKPKEEITEGLSSEQDNGISAATDTFVLPLNIKLQDGENAEDFLKQYDSVFYAQWGRGAGVNQLDESLQVELLSSKLAVAANYLVNKTNFVYADEGTNKPAQNGLAYVWASRKWEERLKNGNCSQLLHGLDCSGMLIRVFNAAGVNVSYGEKSGTLSNPLTLNAYLKTNPNYSTLSYEDKGNGYALSKIETGDIMYFPGHIGIALRNTENDQLYIYQSNGRETSPGCEDNLSKGPRAVKPAEIIKWFKSYGVLKLTGGKRELRTILTEGTGTWIAPTKIIGLTHYEIKFNNNGTGVFIGPYPTPLDPRQMTWTLSADNTITLIINSLNGTVFPPQYFKISGYSPNSLAGEISFETSSVGGLKSPWTKKK